MNEAGNRGKNAELLVAAFLREKGLIISKMNYRSRYGEIDIVAESETRIYFVEVKYRGENYIVSPAEAVDSFKRERLIKTAKDYILKAHVEDLQPRFDVAEVFIVNENGKKHYRISYIRNAFGIN